MTFPLPVGVVSGAVAGVPVLPDASGVFVFSGVLFVVPQAAMDMTMIHAKIALNSFFMMVSFA
jgi:repressor of nif and glnA expression